MSAHTPGPWKAHQMEFTRGLPYTPVSATTMIAQVYSTAYGDHKQSQANAQLIAAAPELLEIAESILAPDMIELLPAEYVANVRAVIAKATGVAP